MSSSANKTYLGDYVDFQNGYAFKSGDYTEKGHYLIRIKNVQQGFIEINDECFVKIPNETKFEKFKLKNGDIVVSLTGNVGRIARIRTEHLPAVLNQRVASVASKNNEVLSEEYLYYLLRTPEFFNFAIGSGRGAAQQNISTADMEKFEVRIPSLGRQREIVKKLDSAFAEIDLLEGNIGLGDEKANQLLQSLLSAAFTSSGDTVDPSNPSANQGFAMNFSVKPLGELCKLTMGRTPPRGNSKYWDSSRKSKNIWISIADMTKSLDRTLIDSKEYLSDEGSKTFPKVKTGTLLLSFKLSIGKLAIAGTELQTNEAIMAMNELNKDFILRDYLYYFLFGFDWSEALEGRFKVKGNTLNKKILEELPIKFPSLEKQREIVEKLDSAFAEIELLKAQIKIEQDYATALRQSLLSNTFTQEDAVA